MVVRCSGLMKRAASTMYRRWDCKRTPLPYFDSACIESESNGRPGLVFSPKWGCYTKAGSYAEIFRVEIGWNALGDNCPYGFITRYHQFA